MSVSRVICKIIFIAAFSIVSNFLAAQTYQPNWQSLDSRPVPQWYKDAKFGIFIHWGVYSVPSWCTKGNYAEWYQYGLNNGDTARINFHKKKFGDITYYQLADQFKAELFNPDEWAAVFEKAGAKYIVLTSKHHDGFANWSSKEASKTWGFPWNSTEVGPHKDLLGDLFAAVRKTTVRAGMYYSLYEWFNPLWKTDRSKYVNEHMLPQMRDLITTYEPDVFWTDGDWDAKDSVWKSQQFLAWLYNESPVKDKVVTFDRWGAGIRFKHGAVFTPEYQPDLSFENHYWEESRGMGHSYGYNREEDAWDYNSTQTLIINLIDKVSRGGNFLLDIGPDEHGKIPPIMQERLLEMGEWLKTNGEAIYETNIWRYSSQWGDGRKDYKSQTKSGDLLLKLTIDPDPDYAVKECFFTYNPTNNNLYVLLPKWVKEKKFVVHDLFLNPGTTIELLATNQKLKWNQTGKDVEIIFPEFDPEKIKDRNPYVLKINNAGAFASKPQINFSYPGSSLKPFVSVQGNNYMCFYTLDGSQPTEKSSLYTKPFYIGASCVLKVRAFSKNVLPSSIVEAPVKVYEWNNPVEINNLKPGIKFSSYELRPDSVNDIDFVKPVKSGVAKNISTSQATRLENYGLQFEGYIKIADDAVYSFYLSSDDGSKLWIDNNVVIDNDGMHSDEEKNGSIALKKGYHHFKLAFVQGTGDAVLNLLFSNGGKSKKVIPPTMFYYK
ncbi:MAG TPA: alpha-L-fucosidase [Bacteroidia bacterium]|nr:alpha-L-fucosidase [Bacteroidia bacterium]HNU33061.1 alpha-L-fucosidase [Bacteroidia bacterium]